MFSVRKRNISLRNLFLIEKSPDNNHFGGYIFLCLPLYKSNYCKFKIKPQVLRTSNLSTLTVDEKQMKKVNKQCLLDNPPPPQ